MNKRKKYILEAGIACVRESGYCNMYGKDDVQYAANYLGFFHLVVALEEMSRAEYIGFLESVDFEKINVPNGRWLKEIVETENSSEGWEMVTENFYDEMLWAQDNYLEIEKISMIILKKLGYETESRLELKKIAVEYQMNELEESLLIVGNEEYFKNINLETIKEQVNEETLRKIGRCLVEKDKMRNALEMEFHSHIHLYEKERLNG